MPKRYFVFPCFSLTMAGNSMPDTLSHFEDRLGEDPTYLGSLPLITLWNHQKTTCLGGLHFVAR